MSRRRREIDFLQAVSDAMQNIGQAPPPQRANYGQFLGTVPRNQRRERDVDYDLQHTNWYMLPKDVLDFLAMRREFTTARKFNLPRIGAYFDNIDDMDTFVPVFPGDRTSEKFDLEQFIQNEYKKLFTIINDDSEAGRKWLYPHILDVRRPRAYHSFMLSIPGRDVRDLPIYIMLFILKSLADMCKTRGTFKIFYQFGGITESEWIPVKFNQRRSVEVVDGTITLAALKQLFNTIIYRFTSLLPGRDEGTEVTWSGSDHSGTRIMLHNYSRTHRLYIQLRFQPAGVVFPAHCWSEEVEKLIDESVGNSVMSVRNRTNNKCLIYCIVMGLIVKMKPSGARVFGNQMMVEDSEVYAKGMYLFLDSSPISLLIQHLTQTLMPLGTSTDPLHVYVEHLNVENELPMSVHEFRDFFEVAERTLIPANYNIGIDVYGLDYNINKHVYPLYISKIRENVIELLCVTPKNKKPSHYCLIINMEKLLKGSGGKQFFSCSKCGECFYHRRLLKEHKCPMIMYPNRITIDGEGGYHYSKRDIPIDALIKGICYKCRLCFITDFEYQYHEKHCLMQGHTGYRHVQLVSYDPSVHPQLNGVELDHEAEEKFVKRSRLMYADFESSINPETGEHSFMSYGIYDWSANLYECGYDMKRFFDFVLDNAFANFEDQVFVYFHNAMGYDANFILRYVLKNEEYSNWGIQVIMKSSNRLQKLVFHVTRDGKTRVIHIGDTFLFLTLSLERIVGSIRKDDVLTNLENFSRFFEVFKMRYPWVEAPEIDHILRKNIFPYKFFTDSSKLETDGYDFLKIFEPRQENLQYFSERVTLDDLDQNFDDTRRVMSVFHCETARDYHDLYLCCDVMQLADVFDRSMRILWESHHIHLTRYIGMPSASWAAFLRYDSKMSIPLYENTFFAEFFKGMIRGGITSAALRHAVADEKHSIIYLDVNGLYPYVMQKYPFPSGRFEFINMNWEDETEIKRKLYELFDKFEHTQTGMCFCVDMKITDEVKKLTDMYPFAPEHRTIYEEYYSDENKKELTPFLKRWAEANDDSDMCEFKGLVCTLYDKEKYNVHWRLLKFYMEHGVVITKVWFGITFKEDFYLAGYIRKNISIRNERKDELGKTLYKLLGNSIYGKTFESPFKRNTYEIIRSAAKLQGMLEEGNIASLTPIDDIGWIVKLDGEDIILDKPTYIGACVCEFSKLHMYTLLYDKLMHIFPECQLVYTDTDSFIIYVKHPDEMIGDSPKELFDYIKRVDPDLIGGIGGQVKSETGEDDTIQEVIALRSKVYAYMTKNGHLGKRAKGTTYDAQELQLDWETYKKTLESLVSVDTKNSQFVRSTFKITSMDVFRQSLSVNDGKRFICEDGVHTHAFGF